MGKNRSLKFGFARTKIYPHIRHPAYYKRISKELDKVEYMTFTHHDEVNIDNEVIKTIPLDSNISPEERGKSKSYVFPKIYSGKRSELGKEIRDYNLTDKDRSTVLKLFEVLPKEEVSLSSNSKNKKRKCHGHKTLMVGTASFSKRVIHFHLLII